MSAALTIGLTGGIASGKSLVERCFAELGVPVLDADRVARQVVAPGSPALAEIRASFGPELLNGAGELDRAAMRRLVFSDVAARRRLEAITHPRIREAMQQWRDSVAAPYCVISIPLLAEGGGNPLVDRVLVVDTPPEVQAQRLVARDGIDRALAERMIAAQASRAERLAIADEVLDNQGPAEAVCAAVAALHRRYLQMAGAA